MLVYTAVGFCGDEKHYYTDQESALDAIKVLNEMHGFGENDSDRFHLDSVLVHTGDVRHDAIYSIHIRHVNEEFYLLQDAFGLSYERKTYVQFPVRKTLHRTNDALDLGLQSSEPTEERPYWTATVSGFDLEEVKARADVILESLNTTGELPKSVK